MHALLGVSQRAADTVARAEKRGSGCALVLFLRVAAWTLAAFTPSSSIARLEPLDTEL